MKVAKNCLRCTCGVICFSVTVKWECKLYLISDVRLVYFIVSEADNSKNRPPPPKKPHWIDLMSPTEIDS